MIEKAKILIVDDLPEKRLVYQSILEDLDAAKDDGEENQGVELVMARSATEALKFLLHHDFAVILLDVNMPEMDGFEAAAMIRARKRSAHTPIIFITAYVDDLHVMKGYSYGAVDYILSPVQPDVLRTKVRVFVELFRQRARLKLESQKLSALNSELTTLNATMFGQAAVGILLTDLDGRVLEANERVGQIVGRATAELCRLSFQDLTHPADWANNWRLIQSLVVGERAEFSVEERYTKGRPPVGGSANEHEWVWVNTTVSPLLDEHGRVSRLMAVIEDISERKRAEEELTRHRERLEDLVRERTAELEASYERLQLADRLASIGTLAAGLGHDMGNLLLPVRARLDSLERDVTGASVDAPDGPDAKSDVAPGRQALEDIAAIRTACDYLNRLSQGLRLFALDPEKSGSGDRTDLAKWWLDVESFLRNALPRAVSLECTFERDLPPLAIAPHAFTQVIYNLVQNAGDVMREHDKGKVTISADYRAATASHGSGPMVVVQVSDDGPGMSEEVRQRCMEPFFTTKTRQISTGLGLALVRGAVYNAGGTVDIASAVGRGTSFTLTLPAAKGAVSAKRAPGGLACVNLSDVRMRAYVTSLLQNYGLEVSSEAWSPEKPAQILVLENPNGSWCEVEAFLKADAARRAVVFDAPELQTSDLGGQVAVLQSKPAPAEIRKALQVSLGT